MLMPNCFENRAIKRLKLFKKIRVDGVFRSPRYASLCPIGIVSAAALSDGCKQPVFWAFDCAQLTDFQTRPDDPAPSEQFLCARRRHTGLYICPFPYPGFSISGSVANKGRFSSKIPDEGQI